MTSLFRRILVPHDFSDHATRALKVAAELAAQRRGRLTVLHVVVPYPVTPPLPGEGVPLVMPVDLVPPLLQRLEKLVARVIRRRAPAVHCRVVVGDPAQEIVEEARRADSIVMSTAGRTGLAHLLIGSVAEKVVRQSPRPVLTLRSGAAAARGRSRRRA